MENRTNDASAVETTNCKALHALAVAIADHAARSEIELYAIHTIDARGRHVFDTAHPREASVDQPSLALVAKAVCYIEMRGEALPYRLARSGSCVWFDDAGPEDSPASQQRG